MGVRGVREPDRCRRALHAPSMTMTIFERPLPEGSRYPCSLDDIRETLAIVPPDDLDGLWAVGLAPGPRAKHFAYATYFGGERPVIHIFSYAGAYAFRMLPHTRPHNIEQWYAHELAFGMRVEQCGARFQGVWEPEDLRLYVCRHILLHEVGHHVFRARFGYHPGPTSERYADDYACRLRAARRIWPATNGRSHHGAS